jgi:hypothetical protein
MFFTLMVFTGFLRRRIFLQSLLIFSIGRSPLRWSAPLVLFFQTAPRGRIAWMPWIERPAIRTNCSVIAALLDDLLRAVVMESAQTLQLTEPKRIDVTSVRNDMIRDAGCREPAFALAHATERLDLQLIARPFAPTFPVQMSPSTHAQHSAPCPQSSAKSLDAQFAVTHTQRDQPAPEPPPTANSMPQPRRRHHGLQPDCRRALELLAASRDGCTEAIMLAHGFTVELMVDLCIAALAIATVERMVVGGRTVEIVRLKITEVGQQALASGAITSSREKST